MMDKRTLWIVLACMLALFGLQALVNRIYPPIPKKPKPVSTNVTVAATNVVEAIVPAPTEVEKPVPGTPERIVSLSNDFVRVNFTSWGGGIRSVNLLKHHTALGGIVPAAPSLAIVDGSNDVFEIQQPNANTVVLHNSSGVTKTFSLSNDYVITGNIQLPGAMKSISLDVGTLIPSELRETPNYLVVDWQVAPKFRNRTQPRIVDRVKAGTAHEEIRTGWVAVKSQYFAMVLSPATNVTGVSYASVSLSPGPPPIHGVTATAEIPVTRNTDGSGSCAFTFYAGPKEYNRLVALGSHQEELMDFGTPMDFYSGIFGVVLVRTLGFFYSLIPSYGVAIILVTVALKLVFWPIQAKSIKSMKEMQKFQPLMQKVRDKYKDDPQRMNQELWKLQREHGINPAAGCLPMVVQLPVLIAFYRVLISDIALRGASFLWIRDLAQPDTVAMVAGFAVNPLPLVMVVTMILQQRMTPQTGDAQQQKMMMFMPLMMLLFFYKTAAGLTLYWTLQQVLSILQQWWGMRHDKKVAVLMPAGKAK
jgi:YidC/Oxa1 family membrane protein insertase